MNTTNAVFTNDPNKESQFTFTDGEHWFKWSTTGSSANFSFIKDLDVLTDLVKAVAAELVDPLDDHSSSLTFSLTDFATNVEQSIELVAYDTGSGVIGKTYPTNIPTYIYKDINLFFSSLAYYVFGDGRADILSEEATKNTEEQKVVPFAETEVPPVIEETTKEIAAPVVTQEAQTKNHNPNANHFTKSRAVLEMEEYYNKLKKK